MNFLLKAFAIFLCFICLSSAESFGAEQVFYQDNAPTAIPVLSPAEAVIANNEALSYFSNNKPIVGNNIFDDKEITPEAIPVLSPDEALKINNIAINLYKKEMLKKKAWNILHTIGLNKNVLSIFVVLIPFLLFSDMLIKKNRKNSKKKLSLYRRFYILSSVSLFLFGLLVFVPWSIYFGNSSQFTFIFQDFFNITLVLLSVSIICLSIILIVIPQAISDYLVAVIAGLGLCVYIQSMFMNCFLGEMNGTEPEWNQHYLWGVVNIIIWIVFVIGPIIAKKKGIPHFAMITTLTATAFLLLEIVAAVSMVISSSNNVWERKNQYFIDASKQFQFSSEKNILVIIFDQLGGGLIEPCFEADPYLYDDLKDFTWYSDARGCYYSATVPALLSEVTGSYIRPAKDVQDLIEETWHSKATSSFYSQMQAAGYQSNIYVPGSIGKPESFHNYFSNVYKENISYSINQQKLWHCLVQISGFSAMPYFFKKYFFYGDDFSNTVVQQQIGSYSSSETAIPQRNDLYYNKLSSTGILVNAEHPIFSIHYSRGPHAPRCVDERCQYHVPYFEDLLPGARSSFFILSYYIQQLKEKGIYDKTAIVVFSDHGCKTKKYDKKQSNISLFIKPFFSNQTAFKKDSTRVLSLDILPTILQLAVGENGDYSSFDGLPLSKIPSDRIRKTFVNCNHPKIPSFRDYDGNALNFNCFGEYLIDADVTGLERKLFERYIPLDKNAHISEDILKKQFNSDSE